MDLPDDIIRLAKIAAVDRGSSLRLLVTDALRQQVEAAARSTRRPMTSQPIKLSADLALHNPNPDAVKPLHNPSVTEADTARATAVHR